MSSNYLFTYTKTDIAFITLKLCKLHKRDASYLCIFADVIYMNMRIEISAPPNSSTEPFRCNLYEYED